jgi:hypothetical protein
MPLLNFVKVALNAIAARCEGAYAANITKLGCKEEA